MCETILDVAAELLDLGRTKPIMLLSFKNNEYRSAAGAACPEISEEMYT